MSVEARLTSPREPALTAGYAARVGSGYDELLDGSGNIRPHWGPLVAELSELPSSERAERAERLNRRVREMGIAHDIFADPAKPGKRWEVDLVPFVISSSEWRALETALVQRARLFSAILSDIYGAQRLMRDGLIPPALVFSDPAYLSACHDMQPASGHLHFYSVDLGRNADGTWRVVDNHLETPAGIGYALANRVVHTHIAGDLFQKCNALRLAPFFQRVQSGLTGLTGRRDPRIALLTPGPHHDDYFSHAYLARYLGYLLVEAGDLRTAGDRVFLKTLEGLKRIDLIVRCVDGRGADPLELDGSAYLGPPGLVHACRRTPELVRNAPGVAAGHNRGPGGYLPDDCKNVLGEVYPIPAAQHWRLVDRASRQHVLNDRDRHVIPPSQELSLRHI